MSRPRPSIWSIVLVACAAALVELAVAHGDHAEIDSNPSATYSELHMAQEHHMDSFDIQAFFHLHDLNRDGVLDRNEIESIYGVHHEKKRKGAKNLEVHTQQANEILDAVLEKLDQNGDGLLTMREFVDGGVGGLPNFKGVEHLGHHYGAHEEQYHNTPETQTEESYVHPEDIEHFMSHETIEHEEEAREREFTGEDPDIAPEDLGSTREEAQFVREAVKDEDQHNPHAEMVSPPPSAKKEMPRPAAKFSQDAREARQRGEWGTGQADFARPKDAADRLRRNIPYKYKVRNSAPLASVHTCFAH
ncbi:hypothetical protein RHOSPDRAFT_18556 [Rhodotorula sp. JG-1b]|nr:hypothetical protein RHOSPDRAFT_18556 [Rhodotorula sp. JG-1b]